ncbi:MAG: tRNA (adenosine(37)-N6)-threonylcarbamoyltransferase complex ATPase subunit type 1 TsaE [Oscillospiraceae bacterium]|nr:tRNA (adenosine(37)-N6)-threonylcarbamoyltransferase complex ATPase subunit type 1 TsaE [Oscillospiraceae bacterium]
MHFIWNTSSPEETIALAQKIGARLRPGDCIAYRGDLGAGKTTFTRGLALSMGMEDCVTSPTFALVHEYGGGRLIHFDMYRIADETELETTGFYDYPSEECVFVIEWSENIEHALPAHTIQITLERTGDADRSIILEGDERFADIGT